MISSQSSGAVKEIAHIAIDYIALDYVKKEMSSCELKLSMDPTNNFIQFDLECSTEEALRLTDEILMSKIIDECERRGLDHIVF